MRLHLISSYFDMIIRYTNTTYKVILTKSRFLPLIELGFRFKFITKFDIRYKHTNGQLIKCLTARLKIIGFPVIAVNLG